MKYIRVLNGLAKLGALWVVDPVRARAVWRGLMHVARARAAVIEAERCRTSR